MEHYLIRSLLKIALGLFFLVIGLLVGLTGIICYPYRLLVLALSKIFRPDLVEFVRGHNITFVFGSDTVPVANICICFTFDGVITVEEFRERFQKNVLPMCRPDGSRPYDRLKQTITKFMNFAFYRWVEDFNLNEHVRPYDYKGLLALPINEGVTEKDIQRIAGKLISLPYAPGKGHWEFLIVQNFIPASTRDRKTLLLLRISHALADGYSIQELLFRLSDTPGVTAKFQKLPRKGKSNIWAKLWSMTLLPGKILWDAGTQALDLLMIDQCSWKIQKREGENSENMTVFTKAVHVDVIKAIKNIHRVSYASVLLAALSSSIYRVMKESGQRIPNKMYCILPAPKPNHPGGLTNHLLASFLPLPIVPHASPSSIAQIDAHFQKVTNTKANVLSELILQMNAFLPLFLAENIYCTMKTSAAVGIFPVVSQRCAIDGKIFSDGITLVASLAGKTTNGATISMGGVNNLQRISICMDKRAFPNEEIFGRLAGYIEDEIDRMKESLRSHKKASLSGLADIKKQA